MDGLSQIAGLVENLQYLTPHFLIIFHPLALGDIMKNTMSLLKKACFGSAYFARKRNENVVAVFLDHFKLDVENFTNGLEPGKIFFEMIPPVRMQKISKGFANDFFPGISKDVEPGVIDSYEMAFFIQRLITERDFIMK